MPLDLASLLAPTVDIAVRAGAEILEVYDAGPAEAQLKDDNSPLTAADLRAHALITAALRDLGPGWPVLSEEAAAISYRERRHWSPFWLVDPLDGTREFISRNGEFTVNIALVVDHRPVLGVVHVPVQHRTYYGASGVGAFRRDAGGVARSIAVRKTAASPLRVAGSRSHGNDALGAILGRLGPHELVAVGSSIKLCMLAEGTVDLYPRLGATSEWDTAAGQALLESAGGALVDLQNFAPLRYNSRDSLINPHFLAYADPALPGAWRNAALVR